MYGSLDRVQRLNKEVLVKITEVNPPARTIWAEDGKGLRYGISFAGLDPLISIPSPGEKWMIKSDTGFEWRLMRRYEDGTEKFPVDSLRPGDRRLEANGLFISTNKGIIADSQLTLFDRDEVLTRAEGVTLYSQNGELRVRTSDGKDWKVTLEAIE
jgi:hypothetical protein